MLHSKH